jgi:hypothetical protein
VASRDSWPQAELVVLEGEDACVVAAGDGVTSSSGGGGGGGGGRGGSWPVVGLCTSVNPVEKAHGFNHLPYSYMK